MLQELSRERLRLCFCPSGVLNLQRRDERHELSCGEVCLLDVGTVPTLLYPHQLVVWKSGVESIGRFRRQDTVLSAPEHQR